MPSDFVRRKGWLVLCALGLPALIALVLTRDPFLAIYVLVLAATIATVGYVAYVVARRLRTPR